LKKIECINKDCLFLHRAADESDIISREDLNSNKNIFMEQQLYAIRIADIYNPEIKKKLLTGKKLKTVFPPPDSIYKSEIVISNDPNFQKNKMTKKKYFEDLEGGRNMNINMGVQPSEKKKPISTGEKNQINDMMMDKKINEICQALTAETTSTSSREDIHYTNSANEEKSSSGSLNILNSSISLSPIPSQVLLIPRYEYKLFSCRERSRFTFVNGEKTFNMNTNMNMSNINQMNPYLNENDVEFVPNFVQNLILKKVLTHKLTKNMKNMEDILYQDYILESEYKNKNPWAQFIIENKHSPPDTNTNNKINEDDDELIEDFENINKFILNTCKTYK
jgi:hypothetical protein